MRASGCGLRRRDQLSTRLGPPSHLTPSYFSRAAGGDIFLADGILKNCLVSIVVAALFLPFLLQALAAGFGLWTRGWRLMRHGMTALSVSTVLALSAGALVAWIDSRTRFWVSGDDRLTSIRRARRRGTVAM